MINNGKSLSDGFPGAIFFMGADLVKGYNT
jgi:hypothetical protein